LPVQASPAEAQVTPDAVQRPAVQTLLQQSPATLHAAPVTAQIGPSAH
jgi:hypothetical protein